MLGLLVLHVAIVLTVTAQQNLARFGWATQSSQYGSAGPKNAVNCPISNEWGYTRCTHTSPNSTPAWWMFNISYGIVFITDIKIYYREGFARRMHGFKLYVSNSSTTPPSASDLCYKDPLGGPYPAVIQTIPCYQLGQYVIYYDDVPGPRERGSVIELCYVAINGCQKTFWGSNCTESCRETCIDQHCYPGTGLCVWGCHTKHCFNDRCDKATAICTNGCKEKRTGLYCNKYNLATDALVSQNPIGTKPTNLAIDGDKSTCSKTKGTDVWFQVDLTEIRIVTELYITGKVNTTGNGLLHKIYASNSSTEPEKGTVLYQGILLPQNIKTDAVFRYLTHIPAIKTASLELEICDIGIVGCPSTQYGPLCELICPAKCLGPCDLDTGRCIFGCLNGWIGEKCDQACSAGFYGSGCLQNCSLNCVNPSCHHTNGECIDGCNSGWKGFNCTQGFVSVRSELQGEYYGTAIGGGIGAMIAVILIMFAGFVIYKDNKKLTKDKYSDQSKSSLRSTLNRNRESNHVHEYVNAAITSDTGARTVRLEATTEETELLHERDTFEHRQIPIENSVNKIHIEKMKEAIIEKQKDEGFEKEYQILPKGLIHAHVEGSNEVNKDKNRFRDLWPYDHSRIVLKGNKKTDYINATYIDNYDKEKAYIATQDRNRESNHVHEYVNAAITSDTGARTVRLEATTEETELLHERDTFEHRQIPIENSVNKIHIEKMKEAIIEKQKDEGFEKEYQILPKGLIHAHVEGSNEVNKDKNRFRDLWPYDHSRIVLKGNKKTDYINATYIDNYDKEKAYIATQDRNRESNHVHEYVNAAITSDTGARTVRLEATTEETELLHERDTFEHRQIPIENSVNKIHIEKMKEAIIEKQKDEGFEKEYQILPKGLIHAHVEGSNEVNKDKNRFRDLWPYDHSRIVLKGNKKTDYINANYIDNYDKEKAYIATQGPKKNTVRDFWHMIWQENVGKMVMVTQLKEGRRNKCVQYWPDVVNEQMVVENYRLTLTKEKEHTLYVYRLITIFNHNDTNRTERKVHQFHFTQWPDHGVPDSIKLVHFYRNVKSEHCDQNGPMVVHCSAGIGRTGTFIAIDALYENGKKTKYVNVIEYVQMMRKDRMNMIQTHEQYATVFEALLELFTVPNTSIKKGVFCKHVGEQECMTLPKNRKMFKLEFQTLESLRPAYHESKFSAAKLTENISKNWVENILPHDNFRPYLMSYGRARTDYINAVIIPGHREESTFLVTQCPLKDTVVDFWTMIYDHNSRIIVLLDQVFKNAQLWLENSKSLEFDNFRITQEGMSNKDELQISLFHQKQHDKRIIQVFKTSDWQSPTIPSTRIILDLLKSVVICSKSQNGPVTVVCRDGGTKSGLFVALYLILDKINIDEEVDIFQVVRSIQTRRPEFLKMSDQYEYCYRCIKDYLEGESLYANT